MLDEFSPLGKTAITFAMVLAVISIACFIFLPGGDKPKAQATVQGTHVETPPAAPPAPKDPVFVYDPPGIEQAHAKKIVEGVVWTVKWNGNDPQIGTDKPATHYQPDSTEVETYEPDTDEDPTYTYFCGNVLEKFTPGKRFKMVLKDSNVSDYNGCYTIDVVELTFGGKGLPASAIVVHPVSRVPGSH